MKKQMKLYQALDYLGWLCGGTLTMPWDTINLYHQE